MDIGKLIATLGDNDTPARTAADTLIKIGQPAVPLLMAALNQDNAILRGNAARTLGWISDPQVVPSLIALLTDTAVAGPGERVCDAATMALQIIGAEAVPDLIVALAHNDVTIRRGAAEVLGMIAHKSATQPLIDRLRDPVAEVRASAATALGDCGDPAAVPALGAALTDSDAQVRSQAATALGKIVSPDTVPPLIGALTDSSEVVRGSAALALGTIRDAAAVQPLIDLLADNTPIEEFAILCVCDVAAIALEQIATEDALQAVSLWREQSISD